MGQIATQPDRRTSRKSWARRMPGLLAVSLLVVGSGTALALPASAAAATGQIYVIQGLTGQSLDVVVDGKVVLKAAKPKTIVGPLRLDAGTHDVDLMNGSTSVIDSKVAVKAAESVDVVAHPASTTQGSPEITAFRNDLGSVSPGKVRLAVAHTAAAPPADIKVNGDVLFSNVANSEALTVVVPASTYKVEVVPSATTGAAILGPVDLTIKAGTLTRVFAIGDVTKGTMDAVVHAVPVAVKGSGAPKKVDTGDGGQTATSFTTDRPAWTGWALVALLALGAGGFLTRGRCWSGLVRRSSSSR